MKLLILICSFITPFVLAQCRNTFFYGFKIDEKIDAKLLTASVFYNNKPLTTKLKMICGKPQKIQTKFFYTVQSTSVLGVQKLPYQLPEKSFYWLMTDEMNIEMAAHPERFKIVLDTKNVQLKSAYKLPETFDFLSQNAIYLDLKDKSKNNLDKEFNNKIWGLSLSKISVKTIENSTEKDTTIIYSLREKIPEGVLNRFPEIRNAKFYSVQEFNTKGMYFNQKIFLKIPETIKSYPDKAQGNYIDINGKKCAVSGGITGLGSGGCAGAGLTKKMIIYNINIQIEP